MPRTIQQSVVLPAPAARLFDMYLDPRDHAAISGSAVTIGSEPGARFEAFEGMLTGVVLATVRPRLIVQSWRAGPFHSGDPDSTLVLTFSDTDAGGRIDLVHAGVPDHEFDGVASGWDRFYWTPWRALLESR
jgi:activator of HSP90 ATPase